MSLNVGTDSYMAPELLRRQQYDGRATDVFALGVILFILVVGNAPFRMAQESDPYFKLLKLGHHDEFFAKTGAKTTS